MQIFNQNITDQPSMKRRNFLVCLFYCFFRLPIYESIAAIFWQSASYVCVLGVTFSLEYFDVYPFSVCLLVLAN